MKVTLEDSMGDDAKVVKAAWVDFARHVSDHDIKRLCNKMAREGHDSPFFHNMATFHVYAPLPVWRQMDRTRIGLGINEYSRRYHDDIREVFKPAWRKKTKTRADASGGNLLFGEDLNRADALFQNLVTMSLAAYDELLASPLDVAPEQARFGLLQGAYTSVIWTGSLMAFARLCRLRLKPDAQLETKQCCKMIAEHCARLWPVSWNALVTEKNQDVTFSRTEMAFVRALSRGEPATRPEGMSDREYGELLAKLELKNV